MPDVSLNCRDGEHEKCTGCAACPEACHAVPAPDSFREVFEAARDALRERREVREGREEE